MIQPGSTRGIVLIVMACHFIAAFAALGMPPFFTLILDKSLHSDAAYLAGWLYVAPTFFAAISSPWWGKWADRLGKKPLLIRAQLGLAASFLLAGFATRTWEFILALVLQGVLGGTFAASNAYLAAIANGPVLVRSLTAMQWSARAALVLAPVSLGLLVMNVQSPIELYRYLALLPLSAALLMARLPAAASGEDMPRSQEALARPKATTPNQVYALQFAFVFATVITFPYFISHIEDHFPSLTTGAAGLLFGLPHLVYLFAAAALGRRFGDGGGLTVLAAAFGVLALSLVGQAQASSLPDLIGWRLLMGVAMTVGFIRLHALVVGVVRRAEAGRIFGRLESGAKWGAVTGGLFAGLAVDVYGYSAPFLVGAGAMVVVSAYLAGSPLYRLSSNANS